MCLRAVQFLLGLTKLDYVPHGQPAGDRTYPMDLQLSELALR